MANPVSEHDRATAPLVATLWLRGLGGLLRVRVSWLPASAAPQRPPLIVLYADRTQLEETSVLADALCAAAGGPVLAASCWTTPVDARAVVLRRAEALLAWAGDHAAELRADERRIAVGGWGRGGALAAAVAMRAEDRGWPALLRPLLIAPDAEPDPAALLAGLARSLNDAFPPTTNTTRGVTMPTSISAAPSVATQVHRTYIKATPAAIWEALTTAEIACRYGYGTPVEYELRPGGSYRSLATEEMQRYGTPEVLIDGEVLEVDEPRRLVHTSRILWDAEAQAEGYTTVAFELEARDDGITRLTVTHDVTDAPRTALQVAGELPEGGGGWAEILSGLKTLLETGRPLAG